MNNIKFIDNKAIKDRKDKYQTINVNSKKVLDSWKASLYSYEWILPNGNIKTIEELPENEKEKRREIEIKLKNGEALEMPVLGIGLLENIEIGIGRHIFLTATSHGVEEISVHVPKSHLQDFNPFLFKQSN
jgi:hypothetical protein